LRNRAPGLFLIAFIVAIIVVVRHLERVELWDTGRLLSRQRPTMKRGLIMPVFIVVDAFSLCAVWCVSRWMLQLPLNRVALLSDLPMYVVPVFVFLVLARTYWRVWSRAQMRDFALLSVTIFAGVAVAMGLIALLDEQAESSIRFAVLFATFSVFPLFGVRLWQDSLQGIVQVLERKVLTDKPGTVRVFAYGGGVRFRSYMREMACIRDKIRGSFLGYSTMMLICGTHHCGIHGLGRARRIAGTRGQVACGCLGDHVSFG
jgi:hypothetical protein